MTKTYCINCGEEIDDPRPGIVASMLSTGYKMDEILNAITSERLYCDDCAKEWNRLNRQAHEIAVMVNNQSYRFFKNFGRERRYNRKRP